MKRDKLAPHALTHLKLKISNPKWPPLLAAAALCLAALAAQAAVTVSNVSAAQTPGTKQVVVAYDVAAETATVAVSLEVRDGDTVLPATSLSGDIGPGVATGAGKQIVWNGGADWNGNVATLTYTVTADDGVAEPPPGMPAGGDPTATSWEEVNERWVKNIYDGGAITMSDRTTGLMWVFDASANGTANWNNAIAHCNNLTYAGHSDWFLPDLWQLHAMYSQKAVFSNVQGSRYWSSTPDYYIDNRARFVDMSVGSAELYGNRGNTYWVWPCRSGQ